MLNDQIENQQINNLEEHSIQINNNMFYDEENTYTIKKKLKRDYKILNMKRNCYYFILIFILIIILGYIGKFFLWSDNYLYKNNIIGINSTLFSNVANFSCHIHIGLIMFSLLFLILKCSEFIDNNCFNRLNVSYNDDFNNDFHLIRN